MHIYIPDTQYKHTYCRKKNFYIISLTVLKLNLSLKNTFIAHHSFRKRHKKYFTQFSSRNFIDNFDFTVFSSLAYSLNNEKIPINERFDYAGYMIKSFFLQERVNLIILRK